MRAKSASAIWHLVSAGACATQPRARVRTIRIFVHRIASIRFTFENENIPTDLLFDRRGTDSSEREKRRKKKIRAQPRKRKKINFYSENFPRIRTINFYLHKLQWNIVNIKDAYLKKKLYRTEQSENSFKEKRKKAKLLKKKNLSPFTFSVRVHTKIYPVVSNSQYDIN